MIKAVLFDLDGTLADTAKDFFKILESMLAQSAHSSLLSYEEIRAVAGLGADAMIEATFHIQKDNPNFAVYKESFLNEYTKSAGQHAELFEGILEILIELNAHNIPWCIVTDKPRKFTDTLINKWKDIPKHISICSDDEGIGEKLRKPDPKSLYLACEKIGISPNDCVYVGDSLKDLQAGKTATMLTIGVTYGYTPKDKIINNEFPADYYVDTPRDLQKKIQQL